MPLVILMRHGQAENNVNRILVGRHIESHLTDYGRQQVEDTARYLQNVPIEKVYVSPVTRTVETAKIVSKILGISYEIDERLYEIELGKLVGMNYDDIIYKYGNLFLKFYAGADSMLSNYGVESFTAVKRRIKDLMDEIKETEHDKNVLMITHLDPIKAAISVLLDLKPRALFHWHIRNAALTILKHESKIYSLSGVNVMSMHRYITE
ncbi:MAG: fructose-2,6-bisphosphatase [Candidatus Nitrosopolaris wilkensis]|nr:MAG: fructose-2,6-bisphosphatase [Candidatus Nitrosopolaris wilkensis]